MLYIQLLNYYPQGEFIWFCCTQSSLILFSQCISLFSCNSCQSMLQLPDLDFISVSLLFSFSASVCHLWPINHLMAGTGWVFVVFSGCGSGWEMLGLGYRAWAWEYCSSNRPRTCVNICAKCGRSLIDINTLHHPHSVLVFVGFSLLLCELQQLCCSFWHTLLVV